MSPCEHGPDLLEDIISFCLYTPSALISTYILMLFCDNAVKVHLESKTHTAHVIAFLTIAGMYFLLLFSISFFIFLWSLEALWTPARFLLNISN